MECPHDLIRQQSGTENWKYDVVFSLYKELFRWNGRLHNWLQSVYMMQVREMNWVQSTYWNPAKADGPFILHRAPLHPPTPCINKSSAVQLNMQQPRWVRRFQWNGLGAIQCASILGLADRAMIPWFTEPQSTRSPDIKRSSANWCSCSHAACDT